MIRTALTVKSTKPEMLGKRYELDEHGKVTKSAVANVSEGKTRAIYITSAKELTSVLEKVCETNDIALMSGRFVGAEPTEKINLVTERALAERLGCLLKDVPGGVNIIDGKKYAARLKRGIEPSAWVLIDADNPEGIPSEWAAMGMNQRLEMLEPLFPGISTCERVEYRSSSARVVKDGEEPGGATHAWIQISDPTKLDILRERLQVQSQLQGLSFDSPRYAKETGAVIGSGARTAIDSAVWVPGRLVFCSKPEVLVEGYHVADAGVSIVNPDGGPLDVSGIELPTKTTLKKLHQKTGQNLSYSREGGSLTVKDRSSLKWDTQIEVKGVTLSLRERTAGLLPGEKFRCEAPFRDSQSEAAFVRILSDGTPMLHDVGTGTNYHLSEEAISGDDDAQEVGWVSEMNHKYAWVEGPKSIYRFNFDDFIKPTELAIQYRNDPVTRIGSDGKPKSLCRANEWLKDKARAQYRDLVFAPGETVITSRNEINTWTGFAVSPVAGNVEPYEALRDHLFPDPSDRCYVEQWLAHKLKRPGVKMNTALVVWSGAEGVGKNLLFEAIGDIIGQKHACVIGQKDLGGSFNSWAKNRLLVIGDEVLSSGDRREADQFKGLITGTMLRINEKNQPEYDIANYTSFVFLSNHGDAVHLDDGNRRYFVAEIKAKPLSPAFYTDYVRWRDGGGLAALHYYLVNNVDLTGFDPKAPPPMTDAKRAMVSAGRSGLEQWMADALEDPVGTFGGAVVTATMLKSAYEHATQDNRSTQKAVTNAAKKAGAQFRASQIRIASGQKVRVMSLADHEEWAARGEAEWAVELVRAQKSALGM